MNPSMSSRARTLLAAVCVGLGVVVATSSPAAVATIAARPTFGTHFEEFEAYDISVAFTDWGHPYVDESPYHEIWSDLDHDSVYEFYGSTGGLSQTWTVANEGDGDFFWKLKWFWQTHISNPPYNAYDEQMVGPYYTP